MDADLLDLLMDSQAVKKDKSVEPTGVGNHIDPLFVDAYADYERASTTQDKAEAMRIMLKLLK